MDLEELVENYISAWNRHDVDALLGMMHEGVAIYDAFWMETCVGRDAFEYLRNSFDEDECRFQKEGDVIVIGDCVSFRYAAYEPTDTEFSRILFNGVEVLNVRNGRIVTVSDYYCDSDQNAIEEVTRLAAKRHGLPTYAESGLSAYKASRYRFRLATIVDDDKVFLDPDLTLSQLSDQVGCSMEHLAKIIVSDLGTDFDVLINERRVKFARDLLLENSDRADHLVNVATCAGFRSFEAFCKYFEETFNETPADFCRRGSKKREARDSEYLH
ncbi:MAG: helix-turn-helix domain-containing protein [Woeseiaceae bacterium]